MFRRLLVLVALLALPLGARAEERYFVGRDDKAYHRAGCPHLGPEVESLTLGEAYLVASEHRPCRACKPPMPTEAPKPPKLDDRAIYLEFQAVPASADEDVVIARMAKAHHTSTDELRASIDRGRGLVLNSGPTSEKAIRAALTSLVEVRSLVVSGEFVGLTYLQRGTAANDAAVRDQVAKKMPEVLAALFSVPAVERVAVKAFWPAEPGGEKRVAHLDLKRAEFSPGRAVRDYLGYSER